MCLLVPQAHFEQAPAEAVPFADGALDLVFLGLVLYEADDALQGLREARRAARLRVAVLEWPFREGEVGPPLSDRPTAERVFDWGLQAGFQVVENLPLGHTVLHRLV